MPTFSIVAKRFSPDEFVGYVAHLPLSTFVPGLIVLHNTAVPTIAQRPNGLTYANMQDLAHYYGAVQGWSGGPHLFVDQVGIWVFNPLDRRGVHSPSWNSISWGVEMLGDFDRESFSAGSGLMVHQHTVSALAAMFTRLGLDPDDDHFKLHKEDPKTTHVCPGKGVVKDLVRGEIRARMAQLVSVPAHAVKIVVYRKGRGSYPVAVVDGVIQDGVTRVDAAALARVCGVPGGAGGQVPVRELLGDRYDVTWNGETNKVYVVERA